MDTMNIITTNVLQQKGLFSDVINIIYEFVRGDNKHWKTEMTKSISIIPDLNCSLLWNYLKNKMINETNLSSYSFWDKGWKEIVAKYSLENTPENDYSEMNILYPKIPYIEYNRMQVWYEANDEELEIFENNDNIKFTKNEYIKKIIYFIANYVIECPSLLDSKN